jgi:glycerophosphoryl diester phosphodiesterase
MIDCQWLDANRPLTISNDHSTIDNQLFRIRMDWDNFRDERRLYGRPFVVAHRGAPTLEPENTLRSFFTALVQGADALETDLRFTADDELILFHDPTLERMTEGVGLVRNHTLAQIKALRTRRPDGVLVHEPVPTLAELIAATGGQTPLLLELKDPLFLEERYARRLVDTLMRGNVLRRSALVSFEFAHVASVRRIQPDIPVGLITIKNPFPRPGTQLLGPIWPLIYLNPFYTWLAHRMGSIVAPLDPTPASRLPYYMARQVDAVLADEPGLVLRRMHELLGV